MLLRRLAAISWLSLAPSLATAEKPADHTPKIGDRSFEIGTFRGQIVAKRVDLGKQFAEEVPMQGQAGSCSSYAAVALMESACRRATKKALKLSEALPVFLAGRSGLERTTDSFNFEQSVASRLFPGGSGEIAHPGMSLRRFCRGGICRDENFSMDTHLKPLLEKLRVEARGKAFTHEEYLQKLDAAVAARGLTIRRGANYYEYETKDPQLRECLDGLAEPIHLGSTSAEVIMAVLAQGVPVLCTTVGHAVVLMGYRLDPTEPDSVYWHIRNSHRSRARWGELLESAERGANREITLSACRNVEILVTKEEAKRLKLPPSVTVKDDWAPFSSSPVKRVDPKTTNVFHPANYYSHIPVPPIPPAPQPRPDLQSPSPIPNSGSGRSAPTPY